MKSVFLAYILLQLVSGVSHATESRSRPNVIVIFIDDEGYGDVGCFGATGFETPHIDQLASEGMRFTHFYAAQAVCSASRAGLMTGAYPNRVGITGALFPYDQVGLNDAEYTMAEMFQDQGYATACIGKWHLGWQKEFLPLQHGFDEFFGLPYSNDMWPHDDLTGEKVPEGHKRAQYPELPLIEGNEPIGYISSLQDQDQLTRRYTAKAVDFIDRQAEEPFFLYLAHSMAHIPLGVSEHFRGKSELGLYGDVMMEVDWSVGEIVRALEANELTDNTLIVFTTDNGPWTWFGNHGGSAGGLREGKLTSWEGGQRVPFVLKWPGQVPQGSVCNQLACAVDLLPTFAAIADGELSDNKIDGLDIGGLFVDPQSKSPRETILYYGGKNHLNAVRMGSWKLVLPHSYPALVSPGKDGAKGKIQKAVINEPELYNLASDPGENYNLIGSYPEKAAQIMTVVEQARSELGDLNVGLEKGSENRTIGKLKE
ncbi:arylsulfatase [Reichenbachiella sp. 5M10]|uniref:sulfatase family protein n=1 Tax=Reichenbachiella sp. 5M10 TaxID=1889772 RepID=UPI000C15B00B|nr:sulfatase [Reichenbachiella sp. 5M10]PIB34906.1 arylsulfatase [Reichenbachiella sp. 5M10]